MDRENIVKLAIDAIQNKVSGNFSASETSETLRQALIEANGGSDKLNPKTFHRGNAVYAIIEELLPYVTEEGLKGDEFFMNLVEYRNLAEGDEQDFRTEDKADFIVANVGHGTQSVRRQRLDAGESLTIPTQMKAIKVYEELRRLMAGRVDFNTFVNRVGNSMTRQLRDDIYAAFTNITENTKGMSSTYVISGTFDENELLKLVEHVEAATGKNATIIGTKSALRKVTTAVVSNEAKSDMYNLGYYGRFNGTPMISVKQAHKVGTQEFILDDNKIYVIAADDRPIKVVNEGEGLLISHESVENADLTQSYLYGQAYGVGVIVNEVLGIYSIA